LCAYNRYMVTGRGNSDLGLWFGGPVAPWLRRHFIVAAPAAFRTRRLIEGQLARDEAPLRRRTPVDAKMCCW